MALAAGLVVPVLGTPSTATAAETASVTWNVQVSGADPTFFGVDFVDDTHGWAVGRGGAIFATTNGGATWKAQDSPAGGLLQGVDFLNDTHGWAVGDAGGPGDHAAIVATTNGGTRRKAQTNGL